MKYETYENGGDIHMLLHQVEWSKEKSFALQINRCKDKGSESYCLIKSSKSVVKWEGGRGNGCMSV